METLNDVALCMASLVVPEDSIPAGTYYDSDTNMYVPTDEQRRDLGAVVRRLAGATSPKHCKRVIMPGSLRVSRGPLPPCPRLHHPPPAPNGYSIEKLP